MDRAGPWLVLAILAGMAPAAAEPVFAPGGPDAAAYGEAEGYPPADRFAPRTQRTLVGTFSRGDHLQPSHAVAAAAASALARAPDALSFSYIHQGSPRNLEDYLAAHPLTGLLIARDDTILLERYHYGRTDRDRFASQSMAKTVTAMLVGIALSEGAIRSIDDPAAQYVTGLAGSEYGATPIRALLQMSSGIRFTERYDGADDISRMNRDLFRRDSPGPVATVRRFNERTAPPDRRFSYAGIETEILGLVLRQATGMKLADYLSTRLWQPMGAEADAAWTIDASGQEAAYCCLHAVLRDYARLGLMLAHDGAWNGRQIVPKQWVIEATSQSDDRDYLAPRTATPYFGYGFQVWLFPGPERMFALLGIHGQALFVHPRLKLVLVHTAVRVKPAGDPAGRELTALWHGLVRRIGD